MIQECIVYRTRGKDFNSEGKALEYRHDLIGDYLNKIMVNNGIHPDVRLKLVNFIVDNRAELRNLLNY